MQIIFQKIKKMFLTKILIFAVQIHPYQIVYNINDNT